MSLEFIYSPKRRKNIEDILYSFHPNHQQRCFIVGFLNKCCNMSAKDIFTLIKNESNWGDLNLEICSKQISSLCSEPTGFDSEDLSYVKDKDESSILYRECKDTSIFSKHNKAFFKDAKKCSYEYAIDCYNVFGKMQWIPLQYPVYRTIEAKDSILLYIDLDSTDLSLCWETAKQIFAIDKWEYFKFSGSKGFHLCKNEKNKERADLKEEIEEIYQTVKTNLVSCTYDEDYKSVVNIDPSSTNKHRFVRGYCINLRSNAYSIPVNTDMKIEEILTISKDLNKIKEHLNLMVNTPALH